MRKSLDVNPDMADSEKSLEVPNYRQDAFGDEEFAEVKYKVLKWWYVSCFYMSAIALELIVCF